ncbi:ATP-binding protein [Streptomyces antibioticus]|uniref:ATP-binding protein n=1 Tax=Streptomyces antibioticus TaxID=1890 RepID=UPI003684A6CD
MHAKPVVPQNYHLTAPSSLLAPRICRDTVALLLAANGHTTNLADTARILVSEVVTNAVVHTATPTLHLLTSVTADGVRVSVYDDVPARAPLTPVTAPDGEGGRGLHLVQALAHDWGAGYPGQAPFGYGKRVWFELRDPTAPASHR